METCCITGFGKKIHKEKGLIIIDPSLAEKDHVQKTIISPGDISLFLISGDHDLTTSAIRSLLEHGSELVLLDRYGYPSGYLLPCRKSPAIENAERQGSLPPNQALSIAKEIVGQAIHNKAVILRSWASKRPLKNTSYYSALTEYERQARAAGSVGILFGIEGAATREYYAAFGEFIPHSFGFHGRNRNPPRDPVNALLSYGYGILYGVIRTALVRVRLSPFYGVLHADYRQQEPLVYDFIEEFRQPVVDRVVMTFISHRKVDPAQFTVNAGGCLIPSAVKKEYVDAIFRRLGTQIQYNGGDRSFSDIISSQAGFLADALLKGKSYSPFAYQ